jgi:nucleoid-associated protein YgaU
VGSTAFIPTRSSDPTFSPDGGLDAGDEPVYEDPPRRKPKHTWSQPPPWMNREGATDPAARDDIADEADEADEDDAVAAEPAATGLAGSLADRLVSNDGPTAHAARVQAARDERARAAPDQAGWAAGDRWDDEVHDEPEEPTGHDPDEDEPIDAVPIPPRARRRERERVLDREEDDRDAHAGVGAERRRERDQAPSWERPARLEAYPTLRARRLPDIAIPPILIAVIALVLAALALFFLPGLFVSSPPAGATPTPTVGASVAPASAAPTIQAEPSASVYVVQAGDTMSKIAGRFGVPLQTLIDANKTSIPNPNQLQIGQVVTIPTTTPTTIPGASG